MLRDELLPVLAESVANKVAGETDRTRLARGCSSWPWSGRSSCPWSPGLVLAVVEAPRVGLVEALQLDQAGVGGSSSTGCLDRARPPSLTSTTPGDDRPY